MTFAGEKRWEPQKFIVFLPNVFSKSSTPNWEQFEMNRASKKRDFSFRTQIKICDLKIQSNHKLESKKSGPAKKKGLPGSVSCRS